MSPLSIPSVESVASNSVTRWLVGIAASVLCLWLAQCRGERIGRADEDLHVQDSVAAHAKIQTAAFEKVRAADLAHFADSLTTLAAAALAADSAAARASRSIGRITFVGSANPPAETPVAGGLPMPEPDTTAYVAIQRQGDPRQYVIPKFAFDADADVRTALAAKTREADATKGALSVALTIVAADSNVIRSQANQITALTGAEHAAKTRVGLGCKVLVVPCLPRWAAFTLGAVGGGLAGYELAHK